MFNSLEEDKNELPLFVSKKSTLRPKPSNFNAIIENIIPKNSQLPIYLDNIDVSLLLFFLGISALTRTIRIYYPKNVIFNENLYGSNTNNYLNGIFFTDNNPPLPKLLMASIAYFAGYRGNYSFKNSTEYSSMFYVMLRLIPAFFSSFCVPLSYLTMRILGVCHLGSSCAAILFCSDLILIVQGRHFMSDGIVHFFSTLSIFSIFLYERIESFIALFFEGFCLGLAFSSKSTTGSIVLLALLRQFPLNDLKNRSIVRNSGKSITRCLILISMIFAIYYLFYAIHISILPFKDEFVENDQTIPSIIKNSLVMITNETKLEMSNNPIWSSDGLSSFNSLNSINWYKLKKKAPSLFMRVISLIFHDQRKIAKSNSSSNESYTSPWWTWSICLGKYVHIWEENENHRIGCICNALLWFPVFFGILLSFLICLFQLDFSSQKAGMLIGYILSYLPFAFINRNLCIFHYMIPLFFGIYNLILLVDYVCNEKARGFVYLMLIHFSVTGYFLWSPLAYGKSVGDINFLFWSKKWI